MTVSGDRPETDPVQVERDDLQYLLAHVADEMYGDPDPGHWKLPVITNVINRLAKIANADQAAGTEAASAHP
jgi:hypothetical protein